ncbi:hypothetical protein F2Q70_00021212 [Brassica cretica]|uniref:Uncharacterized protein n=1 Tax=Brassica cretica TaxID=69181 RepID=A0A8S9GMN0_BRACR|nr:hypothetical protein F2Q70_00021212 [Brassica cretica]KAF2559365.1 hypothetical protein F2Q68_00014677 [Brassica cretica]
MADHCMVIPGKWTSAVCLWNFVIDTKKMQGLFWFVLGCLCLNDKTMSRRSSSLFTDMPPPFVLSYWPPNTKELATELTTPPVILTDDGAVILTNQTHQCTTDNAFDHTVHLSGEDNTYWKKDLDFLGVQQT